MREQLDSLTNRYPCLKQCEKSIVEAFEILKNCFSSGHKLLVAGNGGSCADSEHIVGELMKGFKLPRPCSKEFKDKLKSLDQERGVELGEKLQKGLPAISLTGHPGLNTAFINDVSNGGEYIYAQQVLGYGKDGDVFLGISTSGNSKNIMNATVVAKALGVKVVVDNPGIYQDTSCKNQKVEVRGFEPLTPGLQSRCSSQLSYTPD